MLFTRCWTYRLMTIFSADSDLVLLGVWMLKDQINTFIERTARKRVDKRKVSLYRDMTVLRNCISFILGRRLSASCALFCLWIRCTRFPAKPPKVSKEVSLFLPTRCPMVTRANLFWQEAAEPRWRRFPIRITSSCLRSKRQAADVFRLIKIVKLIKLLPTREGSFRIRHVERGRSKAAQFMEAFGHTSHDRSLATSVVVVKIKSF